MSVYKYSKEELAKDHTVNPNYYKDANGKAMLLDHIERIFPKPWVQGFYVITAMKYLKRFPYKNGTQDIQKAYTYIKHLMRYEKRLVQKNE